MAGQFDILNTISGGVAGSALSGRWEEGRGDNGTWFPFDQIAEECVQ